MYVDLNQESHFSDRAANLIWSIQQTVQSVNTSEVMHLQGCQPALLGLPAQSQMGFFYFVVGLTQGSIM